MQIFIQRKCTIFLIVGMEVIDYFAHPGERKVIGIDGEYPSLVHVVCKKCHQQGKPYDVVGYGQTDVGPHGLEGDAGSRVVCDHVCHVDIVCECLSSGRIKMNVTRRLSLL